MELGTRSSRSRNEGLIPSHVSNSSFEPSDTPQDEDYTITQHFIKESFAKQKYGYFAIFLALIQTVILTIQMVQCGMAPYSQNRMLGPQPDVLSFWGAKNVALIVEDGEWWRLLTPIFLHGGILHIIGNLYAQIAICAYIERCWGSFVWLLVYFGSGAFATLLSCVIWPELLGVGSSGAIMGIIGGYMMDCFYSWLIEGQQPPTSLTPKHALIQKLRRKFKMCRFFEMAFLSGIVFLASLLPRIDWAAHLGGFIGGALIVLVIIPLIDLFKKDRSCCNRIFNIVILVGSALALLLLSLEWVERIQNFTQDDYGEELLDICESQQKYAEQEGWGEYTCDCQTWELFADDDEKE